MRNGSTGWHQWSHMCCQVPEGQEELAWDHGSLFSTNYCGFRDVTSGLYNQLIADLFSVSFGWCIIADNLGSDVNGKWQVVVCLLIIIHAFISGMTLSTHTIFYPIRHCGEVHSDLLGYAFEYFLYTGVIWTLFGLEWHAVVKQKNATFFYVHGQNPC